VPRLSTQLFLLQYRLHIVRIRSLHLPFIADGLCARSSPGMASEHFLPRPITLLWQFLYRTFWVGSLLYSRHSWSCSYDTTVFFLTTFTRLPWWPCSMFVFFTSSLHNYRWHKGGHNIRSSLRGRFNQYLSPTSQKTQ
jgi:hypothetical protein